MNSPARVAAIDCGTNSIRLLIADVTKRQLRTVVRQMQIVRLGYRVDATGSLDSAAIDRTVAATREFGEVIAKHDVAAVRFCATSAVRDAANAHEFGDQIEEVLGIRPQVLSGDEEADSSYLGVTRGLASVLAADGLTAVVDIGGGSTEVITGSDGSVNSRMSFDVGSVRMTERYLASDPPSADGVDACRAAVTDVMGEHVRSLPPLDCLVGVAGTITTVAAHVLQLPEYDRSAINGARLPLEHIRAACTELVGMSVADRRALPFMHPGRADVIGAGSLILDVLLEVLPLKTAELVVSESDILDGIAWSLADSLR